MMSYILSRPIFVKSIIFIYCGIGFTTLVMIILAFVRTREEIEIYNFTEHGESNYDLGLANLPDLPALLMKGANRHKNNCSNFPDLYRIKFSNAYWQMQETDDCKIYLYSAYLDIREMSTSGNIFIRILIMTEIQNLDEINSPLKFCQIWTESLSKPIYSNITRINLLWKSWWEKKFRYFPYLVTCELPAEMFSVELPVSVSLAPTPCFNATNNLKIIHSNRLHPNFTASPKKGFAVCIKALDYSEPKMRDRLIEWIEITKLLGADKIYFYEYFIHLEMKKALNYYKNQDFVEITPMTLPGELPNQAQLRSLFLRYNLADKRSAELIPYNDCFLKNMYDYDYVVVMDTDEIIIPTKPATWTNLMQEISNEHFGNSNSHQNSSTTAVCFQNFYFFDKMLDGKENQVSHIPPNFHMLRHIYRSSNSTYKRFMKCFHNTEHVLSVHNHFPLYCLKDFDCKNRIHVNETLAHMNHYRSTCVHDIKDCTLYMKNSVKDVELWRYKDMIVDEVENVISILDSK